MGVAARLCELRVRGTSAKVDEKETPLNRAQSPGAYRGGAALKSMQRCLVPGLCCALYGLHDVRVFASFRRRGADCAGRQIVVRPSCRWRLLVYISFPGSGAAM